ncbi:MAG: lamin tail domain-containing protein, partial [Patescibacteria group bacterium]
MAKYLFALLILVSFLFSPLTRAIASDVVINEFLPAPSAGSQEWIEFYNSSPSAEYIKSYYVDDDPSFTDDSGSSSKKPLTSLVINS